MVVHKEVALYRTFHLGGPKPDGSSTHTASLLSMAVLPREQEFGVAPHPWQSFRPALQSWTSTAHAAVAQGEALASPPPGTPVHPP